MTLPTTNGATAVAANGVLHEAVVAGGNTLLKSVGGVPEKIEYFFSDTHAAPQTLITGVNHALNNYVNSVANNGGSFDNASGGYTVGKTGLFYFQGCVSGDNASRGLFQLDIRINNVPQKTVYDTRVSDLALQFGDVAGSTVIECTAGDIVQMTVIVLGGAGTWTRPVGNASNCYFSGHRIGSLT